MLDGRSSLHLMTHHRLLDDSIRSLNHYGCLWVEAPTINGNGLKSLSEYFQNQLEVIN